VQILRNKRLVTARELAGRLEVSERTIYRDIQDLSLSGVPVEGEAGVGYHLRYSLDVPPLMFTAAEIEALVVGARMLKAWGGAELGGSAQSVLDKVHAVIPDELRHHLDGSKLFAPRFGLREDLESTLDECRNAIGRKCYLHLAYQRADGVASEREVKPLGLFFWGNVWTLTGWCELRDGFRNFRLDRIRQLQVLDKTFDELPGQRLADFFAMMQAGGC
jgi:predicted DNA-binding transcriptional regulator YafY